VLPPTPPWPSQVALTRHLHHSQLMGSPGFKVSGDGVLTEFQDFRCLFPSWIYQFWALRAGSQLGGLRAQKHAK
jgi:hypothetical protein